MIGGCHVQKCRGILQVSMSDSLASYLHDHLAGSHFAIELLKSLGDQYSGEPLGQFVSGLAVEIEQDQTVLLEIIDQVGKTRPNLKQAAGWLTEKVSKFRLSRDAEGGFGAFEALEILALGILGRIALWRALAVIAEDQTELQNLDFEQLIARAQDQHDRVEENRLRVAQTALAN